jgi:transcriptional regulator GlxA family with amidase domain
MKLDRREYLLLGAATVAGGAGVVSSGGGRAVAQAGADLLNRLPLPGGAIPVAFLIDEGANVMDVAGPWETFQDNPNPGFRLYTVAPKKGPVRMTAGMKVVADYDFTDAPQPKVLVMGAQGGGKDPAKLDWIRKVADQADIVMSICTGAFVLARTGLIDGRKTATHHEFYDSFAKEFPQVELLKGRRFVDNGKFVSAGGLTSGIDAALHVVHRYYGESQAKGVADYMEHDGDGWRTGLR